MTPQTQEIRNVALDIEDVAGTKKGQKIINAFLSSSAEMFRTKRGRLALLVRAGIFEKIQQQIRFTTEEGFDGTLLVGVPADPQTPPAS